MDDTPPTTIRLFETVQIASVLIVLVHLFAVPAISVVDAIIASVLILVLTLLVSRRRKNWARWVIVLSFALGLAVAACLRSASQAEPVSIVSLIALLMQGAAVVLLFTRQSARWLKEPRGDASLL